MTRIHGLLAGTTAAAIAVAGAASAQSLQDRIDAICDEVALTEDVAAAEAVKARVYGAVDRLREDDVLSRIKSLEAEIEALEKKLEIAEDKAVKLMSGARTAAADALKQAREVQKAAFKAKDQIEDEIEEFRNKHILLREKRDALEAAHGELSQTLQKYQANTNFWDNIDAIREGRDFNRGFDYKKYMDDIQDEVGGAFVAAKRAFDIDRQTRFPAAFAELDRWKRSEWRYTRPDHSQQLLQALRAARLELGPYFAGIQTEWNTYSTALRAKKKRLEAAGKALREADKTLKVSRLLAGALGSDDLSATLRALSGVLDELGDEAGVQGLIEKVDAAKKAIAGHKTQIASKKAELALLQGDALQAADILEGTRDCIADHIAELKRRQLQATEPLGELRGRWLVCCNPRSEAALQESSGPACASFSYGYRGRFRIVVRHDRTLKGKYTEDETLGNVTSFSPGTPTGTIAGQLATGGAITARFAMHGSDRFQMTGDVAGTAAVFTGTGPLGVLNGKACRGKWAALQFNPQPRNEAGTLNEAAVDRTPAPPPTTTRQPIPSVRSLTTGSDTRSFPSNAGTVTDLLREGSPPRPGGATQPAFDPNALLKGN